MIENIEEKPQAGQAMSNGLSVEVNNNLNSLPVSISNSPSTEHSKRQVNRKLLPRGVQAFLFGGGG